VAFYNDLLARHPEPSDTRARALLGWAEALWALRTADVNTRLTQALEAAKEALSMLSSATPDEVARGQVLMGLLLSDLPTANQAANLRQAIACYEAALRVYTEEDFPVQWAMTQNNLGTAYQNLPSGDRAANLRQAIACYEAAIRGYEAAGLTEEVAQLRQYIASLQQHTPPKQRIGAYVTRVKRFLVSLRERLGI
jgi:tetratricopeptide (TPR) repeat protein